MKAAYLAHLKRRDPTVRTIEVPDDDTLGYAEVAALGAGDLRLVEKAKLDAELKTLMRAQRSHGRKQNALKMTVRQAEHGIVHSQQAIADIAQNLIQRTPTAGDAFTMTIDGTRHTKRSDAATHLRALLVKATAATPRGGGRIISVGTLGGFTITADLNHDRSNATIMLNIQGLYDGKIGLHHRSLPGGHGLITRLENRLANLETMRQWHIDRIPAHHLEIERARTAIGQPFTQQDQINQIRAQIKDLERQLTGGDAQPPAGPPAQSDDEAAIRPDDHTTVEPASSVEGASDDPQQDPVATGESDAELPDRPDTDIPDPGPAFAAADAAAVAHPRNLPGQLTTAAKNGKNGNHAAPETTQRHLVSAAATATETQR